MKNGIVILLVLLVAGAFYFLGKKNGEGQTKTDIVQNVALIKEIAELASLEVDGETSIKISNKGDSKGVWSNVKNYFSENTLQLALPYEAKYGVDMKNHQVTINAKDSIVTIVLPAAQLLSLQLRLDRLESMNKTGLFSSITMEEFVGAQKQLYAAASNALEGNQGYLKLAEDNIRNTLGKYYRPMGYKVVCVFGSHSLP